MTANSPRDPLPAAPPRQPRQVSLTTVLFEQQRGLFALVTMSLAFLAIVLLYGVNLLAWSRGPDFGISLSNFDRGIRIGSAWGPAREAGIRVDDRITGVNHHYYDTLQQIRVFVNRELPGSNVWHIDRDGERLAITVPNEPLGLPRALMDYGLTGIVGVLFFGLGVLVFVMKPGTNPTWGFLLAMFITGVYVMFHNVARLSPDWLQYLITFAIAFQAAPILHLAQVFPAELPWVRRNHWLFLGGPYLLSLSLFLAMAASATDIRDVAPAWKHVAALYLNGGFIFFTGTILFQALRSDAVIVRVRSRIMLGGLMVAATVPGVETITLMFLSLRLLPHPVFNLAFYIWWPVSIAYSIAQHNLFDVDVYVKRAVGYGVMTALVALTYFLLQAGLNRLLLEPTLGASAQQAYPIIFALLVVFFFNPINARVQGIVDRLFFRKTFDYKETVLAVGSDLASLLDLREIVSRIVVTIRREMFIDTAGVVLLEKGGQACLPFFLEDQQAAGVRDRAADLCIPPTDALITLIGQERKLISRYDVAEEPRYEEFREPCQVRFAELGASLGLPLVCHDELIGILFLGDKKSGKFYTREDIDLLQTLAAEGAIAIQNARLAEQMRQEALVRSHLTRYLSPQIVEQVVHNRMALNLGGRRKTVTVLFSDIRDFTTLSETWPPDLLVAILNEYFTAMVAIIFEHGGMIDKFVGDAIVAVFGSLIEVENPARRAADAAAHMMRKMPELNQRWERDFGVSLHMGVGISTGEVFLGNIGSPERMEFTVIGDTVNVASRFSGLAKGEQVLVTKDTIDHLGTGVRYRQLPSRKVKGKAADMEVFELLYQPPSTTGDSAGSSAEGGGREGFPAPVTVTT